MHRSAAARPLIFWVRIPPGSLMSVCCECCVFVRYRSSRRANHLSRGALPTVVRRCVGSRNLLNEEALTHWELLRIHPKSSENDITFIAHISPFFYFEFPRIFLQHIVWPWGRLSL
jgi:hypothetical protein